MLNIHTIIIVQNIELKHPKKVFPSAFNKWKDTYIIKNIPIAPYKFLGKTFFTITYEENGLLVFRKTVYDRVNDGYIYLYVSFPPEYKEYMTPIVEKMANSIKKRWF